MSYTVYGFGMVLQEASVMDVGLPQASVILEIGWVCFSHRLVLYWSWIRCVSFTQQIHYGDFIIKFENICYNIKTSQV